MNKKLLLVLIIALGMMPKNCVAMENDFLDDETPLYKAVKNCQPNKVALLLQQGADPCAFTAGKNPLQYAAGLGCLDSVKLLLQHNANLNGPCIDGWTPLHWAAQCGHLKICICLVQAGADVNATNSNGHVPSELARNNYHHHVATYLTQYESPANRHLASVVLPARAASPINRAVDSPQHVNIGEYIDPVIKGIVHKLSSCIISYFF